MSATTRLTSVARGFAWSGLVLAVVSVLLAAISALGHQEGLWDYRIGFTLLRWAAYGAIAAAVIALGGILVAVIGRAGVQIVLGLIALAIALALILPSWTLQQTARTVPRIHDITTDTENPPQFVALLAVRQASPNGAAYGGPKIAQAQLRAYPDIRPVRLEVNPAQAYERALEAARAMGWDVVAAVPGEGRIEATATTFWFRFKDDVVIRVTAADGGSRVDIRSVSRVGRSDLGTNAKRIRAFVNKLQSRG
jgi:uncharacterized protein (DUF1499 family)